MGAGAYNDDRKVGTTYVTLGIRDRYQGRVTEGDVPLQVNKWSVKIKVRG